MATPDSWGLPTVEQELHDLRKRLTYLEQASQVARPVRFDATQNSALNVGLTTTSTVKQSVTGTCPVGFTICHVVTWVTAMAVNPTGSGDYLYVQGNIAGLDMGEIFSALIGPGAGGSVASAPHHTLTGLTAGAVITVQVKARTALASWSAHASNQFGVGATFIWFR